MVSYQIKHRRKVAKKAFKSAINALNILEDTDYEQDKTLQAYYEELSAYFTR